METLLQGLFLFMIITLAIPAWLALIVLACRLLVTFWKGDMF